MTEVSIEGVNNLISDLNRYINIIDSEDVENRLLLIAQGLRNKIKAMTPVKTGRLKKSVRASKFSRKISGAPAVFVAINQSKRKGAPHAHLIEYGHRARNGKFVPAYPFFRTTIMEEERATLAEINSLMRGVIK